MENCVAGTKYLIEQQVRNNRIGNTGLPFSEYQKVYAFTNEYIKAYFDLVSFENKNSALTVLASGDHTFNLITMGISNIDTFDTNKLTEYYALGFKRAMILKYDYYTFRQKMSLIYSGNPSIVEISELIYDLLPYMESSHAEYWKRIIDFNRKIQRENGTNLNLFHMLSFANNLEEIRIHNHYLLDQEHYNFLKQCLVNANITFKCANAIDLEHEFPFKYDFILLSNIIDYFAGRWKLDWNYKKLQEYEESLMHILNPEGVIFLKYIMMYGIKDRMTKNAIIGNSSVTAKDLTTEEIVGLEPLPGSKVFSGMILTRKK